MNINAHAASDFKCIYNQTIQGASVAHLSERAARLSPLLTWVQFPLGTSYDSYVKRVSQRSAESRGFSPGTPVSSWLTDEIEDDQISISGYVIQRKDRTHGRGGVHDVCLCVSADTHHAMLGIGRLKSRVYVVVGPTTTFTETVICNRSMCVQFTGQMCAGTEGTLRLPCVLY